MPPGECGVDTKQFKCRHTPLRTNRGMWNRNWVDNRAWPIKGGVAAMPPTIILTAPFADWDALSGLGSVPGWLPGALPRAAGWNAPLALLPSAAFQHQRCAPPQSLGHRPRKNARILSALNGRTKSLPRGEGRVRAGVESKQFKRRQTPLRTNREMVEPPW